MAIATSALEARYLRAHRENAPNATVNCPYGKTRQPPGLPTRFAEETVSSLQPDPRQKRPPKTNAACIKRKLITNSLFQRISAA